VDPSLLDSFKDPVLVRELLQIIERLTDRSMANRAYADQTAQVDALVDSEKSSSINRTAAPRPIRLMEVCGTHTVAIARAGFRSVLPAGLELISGPGCPVCVTANVDIDRIIALTRIPGVMIATFGDMVRVPGSSTSLQQRKAEGAAIEVIYSPLDAFRLAERCASESGAGKHSNPDASPASSALTTFHTATFAPEIASSSHASPMHVVLVGVGFETTTPLIAATIERAAARGLESFSVLAVHKRVPPALETLANDAEVALDALILPGHVSTILGAQPYGFLAEKYHIPGAITGFEPVDILQGIAQLLEQLLGCEAGTRDAVIEIAYKRAVMQSGNITALAAIDRVFEEKDATWRGLGVIPQSGYSIRKEYAFYDANRRFAKELEALQEATVEPRGCCCGEVLRGVMAPSNCPLFKKVCSPQNPIGPCMVSSEGSCAAYFRYFL